MIVEFITEYWYLFAMLVVIVVLLSFDSAGKGSGGGALSPTELPLLQSRENAVIIDVNEAEQYKVAHIARAINVPFSKLETSMGKIKKHKEKPVILTCNTGNTGKKAMAVLKKNDFKNLYVLAGGLTAWKKENLPLEKA